MEFVEGAPLKGPLPLGKAVEYAGEILDALDLAHRKGDRLLQQQNLRYLQLSEFCAGDSVPHGAGLHANDSTALVLLSCLSAIHV